MERVYHETEHQELFHCNAELRQPIPLHIPSALASLGYYVCLKLPTEKLDAFRNVTTHLKVGGLRPDEVRMRAGEGFTGPDRFPSKTAGYTWLLLCRPLASRGDGHLTFSNVPSDVPRADVLVCTWTRFIESGQADDWLAGQSDPQWAAGGVPLGGIGCGKVELCRDGRFRNFSGNNNQDMPFEEPDGLPHAFISVSNGAQEVALTTRPVGGVARCPKLEAQLEFPHARLIAPGILPEVDASVLFAGPLVPHNLQLSSLPGFVLRATLSNRGAAPQTVTLRFAWPNLVGAGGGIGAAETRIGYGDGFYRFWDAPDSQSAAKVRGHGFTALKYSNTPSSICATADGHHYIAVREHGDRTVSIDADARFGSVAQTVTIPAGSTAAIDLALAWEMPRYLDLLGQDRGHYWQNSCRDGMDVLELLFGRMEELLHDGGALGELFGRTDVPPWLRSRLLNCCYPLVTNSVLYKDGRFSINEGPTEMAACFGTIDQRLGAHAATQLLFPELNARELDQFGRIQGPQGGIQHDLGHGTLERESGETTWPDLTCSFVLQCARHAWTTNDRAFEDSAWPRVKKAILRHGVWADEGKGVAQVGNGLGTSYDGYHYYGTTPYMATLWMAALRVARKWAIRRGEDDLLPKIDGWLKAAEKRLEADLWNGRYYTAYGSSAGPKNPNCHAGMLAGQFFARLLCGEDLLPEVRLQSCTDALLSHNFNPKFAVPPDEVSPEGDAASDFGWLPYVEAFGLTAVALQHGQAILSVWEKMMRSVERGGAGVGDTRLMYRPLSGAPSWGAYYMTAPASWLVYDALLDFHYTPQDGVLRLAPALRGTFPVVHPLFWGVGECDGTRTALRVERIFGTISNKLEFLELPRYIREISVNGRVLRPLLLRGSYAQFRIAPLQVQSGAEVTWSVVPALV